MVPVERERILELRRRGLSYGQIAQQTSISRNTVKSLCQRHQVTIEANGNSGVCEQCGSKLASQGVARRFCSSQCRMAWWHAHPQRLNKKAIYQSTCLQCGKPFSAYGNKHRVYCSHGCYITARFKEKNAR